MKVGVIGSGIVGRVLANAFLQEGHQVMLGTRDKEKDEVVKWIAGNGDGQVGDFADAARFGEWLVLATPGSVAQDVIEFIGAAAFSGKLVMDATNPIAPVPPQDGVLSFFTTLEDSLMERLQKQLPEAKLVKVFNSVGNTLMYKPSLPGGTPTMFICGNDEDAKKTVTNILTDFGWETEDLGKAIAARAIEPLCILWCIPGFLHNSWSHAFKLLKP